MATKFIELTTTEARVLMCLTEVATEGEVTISAAALADRLGLTRRWVTKTIANLEGVGLVQRMPTWRSDGKQGPNRYFLMTPLR